MITRRTALVLGMTTAALPFSAKASSNDPRVQTTTGPVTGVRYDGVSVFKGLRYGAPTQRFRPPRRPAPWRDPIRAATYGAASPPARERAEPKRGLSLPERLDSRDRRRTSPGDGLYSRGRLFGRLGIGPALWRRKIGGAGRCRGGHPEPSAQRLRIRLSGAAGAGVRGFRQCRAIGPDPGAAVGARQYRGVRRRSLAGHAVRPVGGRRQDRHPDGHAGRPRPVPPRGDHERPAGHGLRPDQRHDAGGSLAEKRWA